MLHADKSALQKDLSQQMIGLQWKELDYLHTNFQNLATSSALLLGFGFTALGLPSIPAPAAISAGQMAPFMLANNLMALPASHPAIAAGSQPSAMPPELASANCASTGTGSAASALHPCPHPGHTDPAPD